MQPVVTAAEMRALESVTIETIGLPALVLMETAGRAVAAAARRLVAGGHVAVVCGPGNNGGDGVVAARGLRDHGADVTVYLASARADVRGDARTHLEIYERAGGRVQMIATASTLAALRAEIAGSALAIDALFGIGLTRPIAGHLAEVIAAINAAPLRLAVDIPSGLDCDTGRVLGVAVDAQRTVTMAALKVALASAPGFARCGEIEVAEIGIRVGPARAGVVEAADAAGWLPSAAALDHKGTRGHVVIIGGGPGMRGAGRLASTAALRAGAGLVTLAAPAGDDPVVAPDPVMVRTLADLGGLLAGKAAVVIGCGLGRSELAVAALRFVVAATVPAVLDADALNLIAGDAGVLAVSGAPIVITPHPGEAARLLGRSIADVEADRLGAARTLAARTRAVVVLKGARTIVCDGRRGDDYCSINVTGGPALATGGSGDVLAGTIGGLLAQGVPAFDAARAGVFVHGRAGDELTRRFGTRGVIASDLPLAIAEAIRAG